MGQSAKTAGTSPVIRLSGMQHAQRHLVETATGVPMSIQHLSDLLKIARNIGSPEAVSPVVESLLRWVETDSLPERVASAVSTPDFGRDATVASVLHEELHTLVALLRAVADSERYLRGRNLQDVMVHRRAFEAVPDETSLRLRMLHELRSRGYGKAVTVEYDHGSTETLRVAQANTGFPELGVLNRQAPVARLLVSADEGDEVRIAGRTGLVRRVLHLEASAARPLEDANFARVDIRDAQFARVEVHNARRTLASLFEHLLDRLQAPDDAAFTYLAEEPVPRPGENASLSARFFTRTTALQEDLLRRGADGLVVVHGVAGSGKTSIALGRTKFLCDHLPDQDDEVQVPDGFFKPDTAVGYVRSQQLCEYLRRTCQQLALYDMPVREYRELRKELMLNRGLDKDFHRAPDDQSSDPIVGRMAWFAAVERAIARQFASNLRSAMALAPEVQANRQSQRTTSPRTPEQQAALEEIWRGMRAGIETIAVSLETSLEAFPTRRLARRIDDAREAFARVLQEAPAFQDTREQRQNVRQVVRERITRALRLPQAYAAVVASPEFDRLAVAAFDTSERDEVLAATTAARARLAQRCLTDEDTDTLLGIAHLVGVGYRGRDDQNPISELVETSYRSQVFIDEYQDFTETQLFVMGCQADPRFAAVTVVGDLGQRLSRRRAPKLEACFPSASPAERTPAMLLQNLRQVSALARLSRAVREDVLGERLDAELPSDDMVAPPLVRVAGADALEDAVFDVIMATSQTASIAVICRDAARARLLESALSEGLRAENRDTQVSAHAELVRQYVVHFTTPHDAKGLEFDAVIIPDADEYPVDDPLEANAFYVAVSRPRRQLSLFAKVGSSAPHLTLLVARGVLAEQTGTP